MCPHQTPSALECVLGREYNTTGLSLCLQCPSGALPSGNTGLALNQPHAALPGKQLQLSARVLQLARRQSRGTSCFSLPEHKKHLSVCRRPTAFKCCALSPHQS